MVSLQLMNILVPDILKTSICSADLGRSQQHGTDMFSVGQVRKEARTGAMSPSPPLGGNPPEDIAVSS